MTTHGVARRWEPELVNGPEQYEEKTAKFLSDLTDLSRKHGIGIAGEPLLFVMETDECDDFGRTYRTDELGKLWFD